MESVGLSPEVPVVTNRERLEAALRGEVGLRTRLGEEVDYFVDALSSHDLCDAFDNALSIAEHNGDKPIVRAAVDLLIKVGYYRPRPDSVEVVMTGRDRAPVRRGVRYDAELTLEQWLDDESVK